MERVTLLIEDSGKQLSCMLNPERVVLRRSSGLVRQRSLGAELDGATDDLVLRTGGGSTEVELDLLFDLCLGPGDGSTPVEDVRELTAALWRLSERSESGCRAATARLIWGRCWNMRVVVDALAERLEEFSPVGAARRSWLRVRLLRIEEEAPRSLEDVQDELPSVEGDAAPVADADELGADDLAVSADGNIEVVGVEALQEQAALESGLWDLALELQREAEGDGASEDLEASEGEPGELDAGEPGEDELDAGEPGELDAGEPGEDELGEVTDAEDGEPIDVDEADAAHANAPEREDAVGEVGDAAVVHGTDSEDAAPVSREAAVDIAATLRFAEPRAIASCLLVVIGQAYADDGRLPAVVLPSSPAASARRAAAPAAAGVTATPAGASAAAAVATPAPASAPSSAPAAVAATPATSRVADTSAEPAAAAVAARRRPTPTTGGPTPAEHAAPSPAAPSPAPAATATDAAPGARAAATHDVPRRVGASTPTAPRAAAPNSVVTAPATGASRPARPPSAPSPPSAASASARGAHSLSCAAPVRRRVIASERELWDRLLRYGDRLEHLAVDTVESARLSLQRALRAARRCGTDDLSVLETCVSGLCASEEASVFECPERELDDLRHAVARLWARGERERARRLAACLAQLDRCAQQMRAALRAIEEEPSLVLWRDACHALAAPGPHAASSAQLALPAALETRPLVAVYKLTRLDGELPHALRALIQVLLDEQAAPDARRAARAAACELSRREYERRLRSRRRSVFDPRTLDTARLRTRRLDLVAQQRFGNPGEWRRLARARAGSESEPA